MHTSRSYNLIYYYVDSDEITEATLMTMYHYHVWYYVIST